MTAATILLIDDELQFAESMRRSLATSGATIDVAHTWDDGIRNFRVGLHELVIADYNLPGSKHGLKLLAAIKPLRPSARLILISGELTSQAQTVVRETPLVDRYLEKTSDLSLELLREASEAVTREKDPTNWVTVAGAHLNAGQISDADIEQINSLLEGKRR